MSNYSYLTRECMRELCRRGLVRWVEKTSRRYQTTGYYEVTEFARKLTNPLLGTIAEEPWQEVKRRSNAPAAASSLAPLATPSASVATPSQTTEAVTADASPKSGDSTDSNPIEQPTITPQEENDTMNQQTTAQNNQRQDGVPDAR